MRKIHFTKMEGLGNDYVYIDTALFPIDNPEKLAVEVSDRKNGIGSDGLVLIGRSEKADASMRIFNADGSEAQMCGNAARCIGKYLYEKGICKKTQLTLETASGTKRLNLKINDGHVDSIRVEMGEFKEIRLDSLPVIDGKEIKGTAISVGNPHFVIFTDSPEQVSVIGPKIEKHPLFPEGTNVECVRVLSEDTLRMKVWERGSGLTKACGTGACAAVAATCLKGLTKESVKVEMDGGRLQISCDKNSGRLIMEGPANFESEGEIVR